MSKFDARPALLRLQYVGFILCFLESMTYIKVSVQDKRMDFHDVNFGVLLGSTA
jgi:hypothetical protein